VKTGSWAPITLILANNKNNVVPTKNMHLIRESLNHGGSTGFPCSVLVIIFSSSVNVAYNIKNEKTMYIQNYMCMYPYSGNQSCLRAIVIVIIW
jgi:hypothetical protein